MTGLGAGQRGKVRDEIPQISRLHTRVSLRADLFFVGQNGHGGEFGIFYLQNGGHGRIGAYPVVMAISANETAVETQVTRLERRNGFQFSGKEIRFGHAIFFVENPQDVQLDEFSFLIVA